MSSPNLTEKDIEIIGEMIKSNARYYSPVRAMVAIAVCILFGGIWIGTSISQLTISIDGKASKDDMQRLFLGQQVINNNLTENFKVMQKQQELDSKDIDRIKDKVYK